MTTYEIELHGYDTDDGKNPLLIVDVEHDYGDIVIHGFNITDSIELNDEEVHELTAEYLKARFKQKMS